MSKWVAFGRRLLCALLIFTLVAGCTVFKRIFSTKDLEPPSIELVNAEVVKKTKLWFYSDIIEPTKGAAGNHGAPMALAFIFNIKNPNTVALLMNEITFTVKIQNFKLDKIQASQKMWIPPGKANQLRVYSLFDVQSARLNLLVQGGQNLLEASATETTEKGQQNEKKKENWLWLTLQEYWTGIAEFKLPLSVTDGTAVFEAKGVTVTVPVSGEYPKTSNQKN